MKTLLILLGLIASTCSIAGQPSPNKDLKLNLPADSLCPDLLIFKNGDSTSVKIIKTNGTTIRYKMRIGSKIKIYTDHLSYIDKVVYEDGTELDKETTKRRAQKRRLIIGLIILTPLLVLGFMFGANWN